MGDPGFRTVLASVLDAYRARPGPGAGPGAAIRGCWKRIWTRARRVSRPLHCSRRRWSSIARVFDPMNGGFGSQPKFPHPGAVTLLLHRWHDQPAEPTRSDHRPHAAGYGAGRHVRSAWRRLPPLQRGRPLDRPPLRKDVLRQLGAAQGLPRRIRAVRHRGVRRRGPGDRPLGARGDGRSEGGYAASQDADVGLDDDGDYFTWTRDEAAAVLERRRARRSPPRTTTSAPPGRCTTIRARTCCSSPRRVAGLARRTGRAGGRRRLLAPAQGSCSRRGTAADGALRGSHPLHQLECHDGLGHAPGGRGAGRRVGAASMPC